MQSKIMVLKTPSADQQRLLNFKIRANDKTEVAYLQVKWSQKGNNIYRLIISLGLKYAVFITEV